MPLNFWTQGLVLRVPVLWQGLLLRVPMLWQGLVLRVPVLWQGLVLRVPVLWQGLLLRVPVLWLGLLLRVPVLRPGLVFRVGPGCQGQGLVAPRWVVQRPWLVVQTLLDGQRRQLQRYPRGKTSQGMFMKLYILSCFGFAFKLVFLCWVGCHFSDTVCAL